MKLYQLTAQFKSLELLEDSDDLSPEVIRDTLDGLSGELELKATNVGLFIRNLEATAEAVEKAAETMQDRAKRARARADSLKQYLLFNMQACGMTKIQSEYFTLATRKNPPSVVIDDVTAIPDKFMRQPDPKPLPPKAPDKAAIAAAIKAGEIVPGCHVEQNERLEIRL